MGKKRGKDKSFKEDDDFDLAVRSCRHIMKGTDKTLLKKLASISDWTSCQDCKHEEDKENISTDQPEDSETAGMWMCLKCGHRGCGRNSENRHAIQHFETPRSEPHCLVVSLDSWSVWCYICDDEVQYSRTGYLAQLVTNLKKQTSSESVKKQDKRVKEEDDLLEAEQKAEAVAAEEGENKENKENREPQKRTSKREAAGKSLKSDTTEGSGGVSVKGLSNLGNTCFFNAVIQNLSQTQLLRQTLNKVTEEETSLDIKPCLDLAPIAVELDRPGSLTVAMCQLLNEIRETKKGVVTPRELFTQVCKKAARFKGFQQQDSQELLRYLLDGMRAEELKRVSSGIMKALKESRKDADGEELKSLVKEYEKNGSPKNFVDQVFGGEMTSTIMCQQCKTVSVVREMFLDLSLPVADEAYRKKNQKKVVQKASATSQDGRSSPASASGNDDVPAGSKYQHKKAKKQAKKQAKQQRRQQKLDGRVTLDSLTSPSPTPNQRADDNEATSTSEQNPAEGAESEQSPAALDPVEDEQDKQEDRESVGDCSSSSSNRFSALSEGQQAKGDAPSADEDGEEDSLLAEEMEKVNLDDAFMEDTDAVEQSMESEEDPQEAKEYTVVNQDPELAFRTLATRTTPDKQECSVQSCLFQFTEVETLSQNNSLLCVTCTKRHRKDGKAAESKNVYTDALKQMLISSPPPVLTLHLKRFQQSGYSICKVNRHVQFPLVLDLAPFCAVKCKDTAEEDTQVLYSLYGIVEHSGTMRSGHYTAYVKVRPDCPKPSSNGIAAEGAAEAPRASWFHISDTSVQPVSESKVQGCQAYLLFYERIK
ncbi:ubiquitin carboxyl-terminal hydrolase 16 [Salarias fasciatus]|nr:ubiquitin carboxyl-terminal hydrolase 16 [Salarias fasciatus]